MVKERCRNASRELELEWNLVVPWHKTLGAKLELEARLLEMENLALCLARNGHTLLNYLTLLIAVLFPLVVSPLSLFFSRYLKIDVCGIECLCGSQENLAGHLVPGLVIGQISLHANVTRFELGSTINVSHLYS